MTWTYDPTQLGASALFQTRFFCGDTDSDRPIVQDEEILFVLSRQPDSRLAAADICDAIVAKFSQGADSSVGDVSESCSQKAEAYRELAKDLRRGVTYLALPVFGGITHSQKQALDENTELVQPSFRIGGDDHPGVPNERQSTPYCWPVGVY